MPWTFPPRGPEVPPVPDTFPRRVLSGSRVFDIRGLVGKRRVVVAAIDPLVDGPDDLDVLLRHRQLSIPRWGEGRDPGDALSNNRRIALSKKEDSSPFGSRDEAESWPG